MNCKNCKTDLTNSSGYCNTCGGKVIKNRLTIKALFSHFSEEFLNYDNKFFQTFVNLFRKPEDVIGSYINGTRKKYVNVISYFSIALLITGFEFFILKRFFPDVIDMSAVTVQGNEAVTNSSFKFIQENISIVMMLFVPMYALVSRVVFFNIKTFNYTEHLVIFMYILAQLSIFGTIITLIGAVFGIPLGITSYVTGPFQFLYSAYCLKRLYKLNLSDFLIRTLLFFGILSILMIAMMFVGIVAAIFFKDSEFMKPLIEAQEAAKQAKGG